MELYFNEQIYSFKNNSLNEGEDISQYADIINKIAAKIGLDQIDTLPEDPEKVKEILNSSTGDSEEKTEENKGENTNTVSKQDQEDSEKILARYKFFYNALNGKQ